MQKCQKIQFSTLRQVYNSCPFKAPFHEVQRMRVLSRIYAQFQLAIQIIVLVCLGHASSLYAASENNQNPVKIYAKSHAKLNFNPSVNVEPLFAELPHQASNSKPKIALVLGSGGARGYAHIGVLKVLEQAHIQPDMIVGTSAGSIVGALSASGKSAHEIEQMALQLKVSDIRDFTLSKRGFLDGTKIERYINQALYYRNIEQLPRALYIVATELSQGKLTVFHQGNVGQAVRASTAIPSMFVPAQIEQYSYVDGGLVSPLPVNVARQMGADIIIAVDILARPQYTATTNMWGMFNQNINVMQSRLADYEAVNADVVIRPDIREKQHIFSVQSRQSSIKSGEIAAQQQLSELQQRIVQWQFRHHTEQISPLLSPDTINNPPY